MHNATCLRPLVSSAVPATSVSFTDAYMSGELDEFFDCPRPPQTAMTAGPGTTVRTAVAAALASEARRLGAHDDVIRRAEALAHPDARTVVTGQQAGLLLGPVFTLSKTWTALNLASRLDAPEAPVVPVFWLASQDHDTEEVNHAWLLDMAEQLHRLQIDLPLDVPTGMIPMNRAWLDQLTGSLTAVKAQPEHVRDVQARLSHAAEIATTWSDFFAAFYYSVLGADAPVLLDPVRPGIAPLFSDVLAREIQDPLAGAEAINAAGNRLRRRGFTPQLGRGGQATNLFITSEADGLPRRKLLRFEAGRFHAETESWSRQELLDINLNEPGRLTPAAGLRPVTQDAVLPTTALVVGPGELRYFAQIRDVYRLHGVTQPTIWPRSEVTLIEPPVRRILSGYGITPREYLKDPAANERQALLRAEGADGKFAAALADLKSSQKKLNEALLDLDPSLQGAVNRHAEKLRISLSHLENRTAAALSKRATTVSAQHERLRSHLLPAGEPQERQLSPVSFFVKFGVEPVMRIFSQVPESGRVWPEI